MIVTALDLAQGVCVGTMFALPQAIADGPAAVGGAVIGVLAIGVFEALVAVYQPEHTRGWAATSPSSRHTCSSCWSGPTGCSAPHRSTA